MQNLKWWTLDWIARGRALMSRRTPEKDEADVLTALANQADPTKRSANEILSMTGLRPDRLYPTLYRLERDGQIASEWVVMKAPRQRVYCLPTPLATISGSVGGGGSGLPGGERKQTND